MASKGRVLIVTYYYPPNTVILSWKPLSWALEYSAQGYEVHVVTRYWNGSEKSWEEQIQGPAEQQEMVEAGGDNIFVHRLTKNEKLLRMVGRIWKVGILRKLFLAACYLFGVFQIEQDTYYSFKKYIRKTFKKDFFDIVLLTSPPVNVIKLGPKLRPLFPAAFFVADFSDLWDNGILSKNYRPKLNTRMLNKLYFFHVNRWLKDYDLLAAVCQPIVDEVSRKSDIATKVITNGYEQHVFEHLVKRPQQAFTISSIGTIYKVQPYQMVSEVFAKFINDNPDKKIQLNIVGARAYNEAFCKYLEIHIPADKLLIQDRIDRDKAVQLMKDSDLLFYPGWIGYRGIYSGKIFEYLGSQNTILIAPSDKDVIEELMVYTGAGVCLDDPKEVYAQLERWYDEWEKQGHITYRGDLEKVKQYSRESQAVILRLEIDRLKSKQ
jgi:hypothetical protein